MDTVQYMSQNGKRFWAEGEKDFDSFDRGKGYTPCLKDFLLRFAKRRSSLTKPITKKENPVDYEFARKALVWKLNTGLFERERNRILSLIRKL